jgi:hypothetical protein
MLDTATKYVLDLLTDNEELKKFPKEFVNESVKWVKSWFLTPEDPKANAKLEDPHKSIEVKKDIIQDKLADLNENPQFVKELTEKLKGFEQQRARLKNVIADADVDVKGSVHIGDKGTSTGDNYDEKNVIKGGSIKAGGDFRLGDDIVQGNTIINNFHNKEYDKAQLEKDFISRKEIEDTFVGLEQEVKAFFLANDPHGLFADHYVRSEKAPPQYPSLKKQIEALIAEGKTEKAIETFLDAPDLEEDIHTSLLLQSGRMSQLNRQVNNDILKNEDAKIERARINSAIIALAKKLP